MVELIYHNKHISQVVEEQVLLPSSFSIVYDIEEDRKEDTSTISKKARKKPFGRKLALHLLSSFLIIANLAACQNYLEFKLSLYSRHFNQVIRSPWLLIVLACECVYFLSAVISSVENLIPPSNRPDPPPLEEYPTVDFFIPCCKEPTDIPQETIMSAMAMHYPQDRFRVLVLDDGADDDLRAFCQALQVESGGQKIVYLRRPKIQGVPHNFKCGNLNYGLKHSDAKYVVVVDADMIIHPSYLKRLLPFIVSSPNVAFVQIPQAFYNLPIGDPLSDSSSYFYDRALVHRDTLGSATCIGTGAIFRRKHLDSINGFQPYSITEDTLTSFALFNEGYESIYVNEKLQMGLTPWTFDGYIKQRHRWGQGGLQQFRSTWRSMLGRRSKLNIVLKICYFWNAAYLFLSIVNIIIVIVLLCALAFRLNFIIGDAEDNRKLIAHLAMAMVIWRLSWYSLWIGLPQALQSRNHEEAHFWWMTPFFFKMVMEALFAYEKTFIFIPTSNIDNAARTTKGGGAAKENRLLGTFKSRLSQLKLLKVQLAYIIVVLAVVGYKVYIYVTRYGVHDCKETFYVVGLSFFLLTTCSYMLIPVMFILWPTNFKPSQRKKLIKYDTNGAPRFNEEDFIPKWHSSVILYEMLSFATLAFWSGLLWLVYSREDKEWCQKGYLF